MPFNKITAPSETQKMFHMLVQQEADQQLKMQQPIAMQESADNKPVICHTLNEFLSKNIPIRVILLSPWLLKQSLSMLYAWRGIGKSWLALSIAYAAACGGEILGWKAPKKYRVLYIDGELPAATLQHRLSLIVNSFDSEPLYDGFNPNIA